MLTARIKLLSVAGMLSVFGGCQNVGPTVINQGRDHYNSVIQSTAKEQTLSNIIRVYKNEPTSFMDVTEVDTGTSVSGSVNGGISGIGAHAGTFRRHTRRPARERNQRRELFRGTRHPLSTSDRPGTCRAADLTA